MQAPTTVVWRTRVRSSRHLALAWLALLTASSVRAENGRAGADRVEARCDAEPPPTFGAFALGAGVAVGFLNLPRVGIAPSFWARLAPAETWALEMSLDAWLDNDAPLSNYERDLGVHPMYVISPNDSGSIRFRAFEGGVALCPYRTSLDPGELSFCAGVRGGVIEADGIGFAQATAATRGLFSVEGHARWRYHLVGPLGLSYSAGLFVPLLRDQFSYVDAFGRQRDKFRQAPLGGRLDLALTVDL